jgi:ribosome-binding factor A
MGRYRRADRVAGQVHQVLAALIRTEIRDPRVGPLSITAVEVSGDLSVARIRFLPLGGQGDAQAILAGLTAASGFLRRQLGRQIRVRTVPELRFEVDAEHDQAFNVIVSLTPEEE